MSIEEQLRARRSRGSQRAGLESAAGEERGKQCQRRRDLPEVGNFLELETNRKTSASLLFPLCSGYSAPRDPLFEKERRGRPGSAPEGNVLRTRSQLRRYDRQPLSWPH
ncbi:uncharacterized protein LOC113923033 isoform X2 [Zalophus californianus]|uniref:Uncharacterized protein LOC113923033 isoform X2 n=1 Tax=Zalophus californianus TaxID=9704 RepID=A0A6J2D617_ZALCA|nr:uncharacterized protein LOC113923033 isoform X2 [Zalophus californianus]